MFILENLHDINNIYSKILRKVGNSNNLTFEQIKLLFAIPYDGILLSELAFVLGIDNSTLTRNLQKLEKNNFLVISTTNFDKRKKTLFLSDKGQKKIHHIENSILSIFKKLNKHLSIDDIQEIQNSLEKLNWAFNCFNNE